MVKTACSGRCTELPREESIAISARIQDKRLGFLLGLNADGITNLDRTPVDDRSQHSATPVEVLLQALSNSIHLVAGSARTYDFHGYLIADKEDLTGLCLGKV